MNIIAQYFIDSIALGGIFTLAIVLFSVFWVNKSKTYGYLSAYCLLTFFTLSTIQNVDFFSSVELRDNDTISTLLLFISFPFLLMFLQEFLALKLKRYSVKLLIAIVTLLCTMTVFSPSEFVYLLTHIALFLTLFILFAVNYLLFKEKHNLVPYFTALSLIYLISVTSNILIFGWHELNGGIFSVCYWLLVMVCLYVLNRQAMLSKAEIKASKAEAIAESEQYQAAYQKLLIQQEEDQELLESRVQEHTLELNIALQELEEVNRELKEKNTLDELTGLYNRRFYDQKILAEFRRSRRNLTPLSLVVVDIDHFKQVNDTYGHSAGDKCLIILGKLIQQVLRRSSDVGCRYGGEEFCLILPETNIDGAVAFAEELRELVLATSFNFDSTSINLTISCGVCTYQQQKNVTPIDIFDGADKALYQAKADGRNQVQIKEIIAATFSLQLGENDE
ncbi:diguanylate cyclase [Colwellia sp. 1_MG-2023]|uniref:sensor domain-containing diguanylate cyclase n=1 Tax=Colwellia sp. 1_MG-2023 TaxID=3062649 RepID=UPI0026E36A2B|nr:diguanylate cyclase [Colwellia sp. 1_MG-2023]MDO6446749.1 diguanylate cyclase [Colwellia sp. 1_MG-2023]